MSHINGLSVYTPEMIKHVPGKCSKLTQDSEVYFVQPSLLNGDSLGAIHTSVKQKIVYFSTHAVNHGINLD